MNTSASQRRERPPIIAVLGHVDHGKSTLLDHIRKENTTAGEAGGITQHVAAYVVAHEDQHGAQKHITFIDTPGHEAFKAIRARGASIADIAILVVSAEDGVKAQTLEALGSIRESSIPFVVAINKIDVPNADIQRVKTELLEHGVYLEGFGGDVPFVPVSAKTGDGIPDLLGMLLLVAEMGEFTGDPAAPARGYVIESNRDPKRGIAATLIITDGTLTSGMAVNAGRAIAPVRIMEDFAGNTIREATFSMPVRIVGFSELPAVGATFAAHTHKRDAEKAAAGIEATAVPVAEHAAANENVFVLPIIIKADAAGSLEALVDTLGAIGNEYAHMRVISSGIGDVSESDVKTAVATGEANALIIGFNVQTDTAATDLARQNEIEIAHFDIIYKAAEYVQETLTRRTPARTVAETVGAARVIKQFSRQKNLSILGGAVSEGTLRRGALVRISRRATEIGTGTIRNIQVHKQDVDHVDAGSEFGAQIESAIEVAQGDILTCIVEKEV